MSATKVHPIHPIGVDHDIEEIEDKGKPSDPIRNPYVDDEGICSQRTFALLNSKCIMINPT